VFFLAFFYSSDSTECMHVFIMTLMTGVEGGNTGREIC